ncbi:MAG: hypothetical protein F4X20_04165 [Dehalococcoidia bacterium]|nr:hypothetical protein [Dehalococcoidia bacterium]
MMTVEESQAIDRVEADFLFEVYQATVALFSLLQAMEISEIVFTNGPDDSIPTIAGPRLKELKTFPAVSTTGSAMLGPKGAAVQLAYKGWMAHICDKWEHSRARTKEILGDRGIPVKVDSMGDFTKIRNDLIHNDGLASIERSGKCEVLQWFKPSEPITLATAHVFDFLNQMNLLTLPTNTSDSSGERIVAWALIPGATKPESLESGGIRIVSFRTDVDREGPEGDQRFMLSTAFSDGVFGNGNVVVPITPEQFLGASLNDDGNIVFPDSNEYLDAEKIYAACYGYLAGDRRKGPAIQGPSAQYTVDGDS